MAFATEQLYQPGKGPDTRQYNRAISNTWDLRLIGALSSILKDDTNTNTVVLNTQ